MHLADHALHQLDGAGRSGHHAGAQRAQVEARELGVIELGDEHGRHAVEGRTALGFDSLEGGQRIELGGGQNQRGAGGHGRHHADDAAEAVVERHGSADAIALGGP